MLRPLSLLPVLFPLCLSAQEICDNGLDDDGNGLIDLNDPACVCSSVLVAEGRTSFIRNPSFEERQCCPFGFVNIVSPPWLNCATGWGAPTSATTDYFHTCGFAPTGMPLPSPDGEGAVGFYAKPGGDPWFEYIGTCLSYPPPTNILQAGTAYTISLWIAAAATDEQHAQTVDEGRSLHLFPDQLPLAIFGYANTCPGFPIATTDCIGLTPGWNELGRVMVQPAWDWTRVSITFTPTEDIQSVIIGGACDTPTSFAGASLHTAGGWKELMPYFLIDDLMLTEAVGQVLNPVTTSGAVCEGNALALAQPPAGSTGHQWYHNGVALPGQTGTTLDISAQGSGGGLYAMTSLHNGQCVMGTAHVPPPTTMMPVVTNSTGCVPLAVTFGNNAGGSSATLSWDLGDGTTRTGQVFTHTYSVPGTYDVRLTMLTGTGCEQDTLIENAVTVFPGVVGHITATPYPASNEGPVVALSGTGSTGDIASWRWDLGAAEPSRATTSSLTATFPTAPGTYPVMLVVTGTNGCADTVRHAIPVAGIASVTPNVGGNQGGVTVDLTGAGFSPAATFTLIRGQETITPDTTYFINSTRLTISLDLMGVDTGYWDVQVIEAPDTFLLEAGFRVVDVPYTDSLLTVSLAGSPSLRPGFEFLYTVTCQNNGYNDLVAVPVWLTGLPASCSIRVVNAEAPLDSLDWVADMNLVWDSIPGYGTDASIPEAYVGVIIPVLRARSDFTVQFAVRAAPDLPVGTRYQLEAVVQAPLIAMEDLLGDASTDLNDCVNGILFLGADPIIEGIGATDLSSCALEDRSLGGSVIEMVRGALGGYGIQVAQESGPIRTVINTSRLARTWSDRFVSCAQALGGIAPPDAAMELARMITRTWKLAGSGAGVDACERTWRNRGQSQKSITVLNAADPNDKYGPGTRSVAHYVTGAEVYPYTIAFENDPEAALPAQFVTVIDTLDTEVFDLSTFKFTFVTIGYSTVGLDGPEKAFVRDIDMQASMGVNARVAGVLDETTGVVTWKFHTIDPATGQPTTNPLGGFLPPDTLPPFGQGYVGFIVNGKSSLQEGDSIRNHATILFDYNEPIITPVWQTVVDTTPPVSHVLPLPVIVQGDSVLVQWRGSDMLSGVYQYSVHVQETGMDGYTKWRFNTSDTAGWFHGTIGSEYRFYSLATDSAGNVEVFTGYDAITRLSEGAGVGEWSEEGWGMAVFPNPHSAHFTLVTTNPTAASGLLEIVDMTGRRVFQQQVRLPAGRHTLELRPDLAQGMYLLRLALPDREYSARVVRE